LWANRPQPQQGYIVDYSIKIPFRRLEPLFGTAYSNLCLSDGQKCSYIAHVYAGQHDTTVDETGNYAYQSTTSIGVDYIITRGWKTYNIRIHGKDTYAYTIALSIEKNIYTKLKRLSVFSTPRFWSKLFYRGAPVEISTVSKWLAENCDTRDYQIFSKFGSDYSIGFRNNELATMFQLTHGLKGE
jgi:hypothetical protein